jgi:hypothetical protein
LLQSVAELALLAELAGLAFPNFANLANTANTAPFQDSLSKKVRMIERIAILGTGLLGTSAGLALRAAGFRGQIVGWNRSPEQAQVALSMGAIDRIAADPLQAARESQVVLLCMPIYATLDYMEKLAGVLGSDHLVKSAWPPAACSAGRIAPRSCPATPWRARSGAAPSWPTPSFSAERYGCSPTIRIASARRTPLSW